MSISSRLRFAILERDGFICSYCGRRPPEVILHVDHIMPLAAGGSDAYENLCTACKQCNQGKTDRVMARAAREAQSRKDGLWWQAAGLQRLWAEVWNHAEIPIGLFDADVVETFLERSMLHEEVRGMIYRTHVWSDDRGGGTWWEIWDKFVELCDEKCQSIAADPVGNEWRTW